MHGLLDGRVGVKAMTLEYIDIVDPKAAQRVVHALKDVLAGESMLVHVAQLISLSWRNTSDGAALSVHSTE